MHIVVRRADSVGTFCAKRKPHPGFSRLDGVHGFVKLKT